MSKLNILVYLNAYSDPSASNAPSLSNFKWTREVTGIPAENPISHAFSLASGESRTLFSGMRTLLADSSTRYNLTLKPLSSNTYRISLASGTAPGFKTARATGADATTQINVVTNGPIVTFSGASGVIPAIAATFTGQPSGLTTPVTLTAVTAGAAGNGIAFSSPDGLTTLNSLITTWNTGNPGNQVALTSGDGTQIPVTGAVFQLAGGADAGSTTALNLSAVVVGDLVRIGSLFNPLNQGEWKIIAKTANSFTVENEVASNEGPITLTSDFANQIMIYSSAGVQKGDTLVLASGFSAVTLGSYPITDLTANYVEFYTTDVLPIESNIASPDLAIYSAARNLFYLEADQKVQVTINGNQTAQVEPFVINGNVCPGVFMLKSTVWSFTIANNSLNEANLFVASIE